MNRSKRDRILVIEQDPAVADFLSRQVFQAAGFACQIRSDAAEAFQTIEQIKPDVILLDLMLSGFGAKDFIVALRSQFPTTMPIIVIAPKGSEIDVIQAFRLGAADYLTQPMREAEVLAAVDRVLGQVRANREKEQLSQQLQQVNMELQKRVSELSTISSIGKAVLSITDQTLLFDKILEESLRLTRADLGWFMLRDESNDSFLLAAQRKLPAVLAAKVNQPWDDGISALVKISGETLTIHGDALQRFPVSQLGKAAMIIPVKAKQHVNGLLVVMRKADIPFSNPEQKLLEAVVDYVSIALINARLFRALNESTQNISQLSEQNTAGLLQQTLPKLATCRHIVGELKKHERQVPPSLRKLVDQLSGDIGVIEQIVDQIQSSRSGNLMKIRRDS